MTSGLGAFLLVSCALILVPGPNVLVIVATSLGHGRLRGLQTVAGTGTAMLVQLFVAALGTGLLVGYLSSGLRWLKWAGVVYLLYLGARGLLSSRLSLQVPSTGMASFQRGFWTSLTNPKTILFFSAYLPQFVSPQQAYLPQIALLSALFWLLAMMFDSGYALLASRLGRAFEGMGRTTPWARVTGLIYLVAGAVLASTRQS